MNDRQQNWESFVLVLIDVQKDFWTDNMSMDLSTYEENIGRLLAICRSQGIDIAHVRASFQPDKSDWIPHYRSLDRIPCIEGTPGVEALDCASEENGEKVFIKQSFDSFLNPELERFLVENKKRFLLVAGLVTSVCVFLTSATAAQRGYLVAVVEDCCADNPESHAHTLQRYPFIFDRVEAEEIVEMRDPWLEKLDEVRSILQ